PEMIRIVHAEHHIEAATSQAHTANANVAQLDDRILKRGAPERRACRTTDQCRRGCHYRELPHCFPPHDCPRLTLDSRPPPPFVGAPPTTPTASRSPSRSRMVPARKTASPADDPEDTPAECMPPERRARIDTPPHSPVPSSARS